MQPEIKIRNAVVSDTGEIISIAKGEPGLGWTWYKTSELKGLLKKKKSMMRLVATINQRVVGFIFVHVNLKHGAYVSDIAVAKDVRGKGIASRLLEEVINKLKTQKVKSIGTEIYAFNKPSLKLYKKYRFKLSHKHIWLEKDL